VRNSGATLPYSSTARNDGPLHCAGRSRFPHRHAGTAEGRHSRRLLSGNPESLVDSSSGQLKTLDSGSSPEWRLSVSAAKPIPVATPTISHRHARSPRLKHCGGDVLSGRPTTPVATAPTAIPATAGIQSLSCNSSSGQIKDSGLRIQSGVAIERLRGKTNLRRHARSLPTATPMGPHTATPAFC